MPSAAEFAQRVVKIKYWPMILHVSDTSLTSHQFVYCVSMETKLSEVPYTCLFILANSADFCKEFVGL